MEELKMGMLDQRYAGCVVRADGVGECMRCLWMGNKCGGASHPKSYVDNPEYSNWSGGEEWEEDVDAIFISDDEDEEEEGLVKTGLRTPRKKSKSVTVTPGSSGKKSGIDRAGGNLMEQYKAAKLDSPSKTRSTRSSRTVAGDDVKPNIHHNPPAPPLFSTNPPPIYEHDFKVPHPPGMQFFQDNQGGWIYPKGSNGWVFAGYGSGWRPS